MTSCTISGITAKVFLYLADPAATLTAGYDRIVVQIRDSEGTWVDLDDEKATITITADVCNYFYVVDDADPEDYYRPVLRDSTLTNPDVPQPERPAVDTTFEAILSINELKNIYLFGIDLTNDNNAPFPDELFAHYITTAISQIEHELDLVIMPTKFVENYDFWVRDYERFMYLSLNHRPLISVDKIAIEYPADTLVIEFPSEWIRVKNLAGQVEVLPASGTFSQLLVSAGGGFLPLVFGGADYIPDIISVEYVAGFGLGPAGFGFASSTAAQRLPAAIKEVIGKKAAFGPLNTAGDLIVGAGIATTSLSIDGLSQSIGTTSSATNAGYGSRLLQYEKELKQALPTLRRYYKGPRMTVG